MRALSKSKLIAWRQCPKRLWLEVHRPDFRQQSAATQAAFTTGYAVGDVARLVYDADQRGTVLDLDTLGIGGMLQQTQVLLPKRRPIFEAAFTIPGALALADVLLPVGRGSRAAWRMVEVKSSTTVKPYHVEDSAIQFYIATQAGLKLDSIAVAVVDTTFVYPGHQRYADLLKEQDVTDAVIAIQSDVAQWIRKAQKTVAKRLEPRACTGAHCDAPFACGFLPYCQSQELPVSPVEFPVSWLPKVQTKALKDHLANSAVQSMRDVPDSLLNAQQLRVKTQTLQNKTLFNKAAAKVDVSAWKYPLYFLDFETIAFAVPIWKRTRPYQQIPFQFSVHRVDAKGKTTHQDFLDTSGKDPTEACALALIAQCGRRGSVVAYNAGFEKMCIRMLAERFAKHADQLMAIHDRIVDLLPVMEAHYYNPSQQGSWSIKVVLPAMVSDLRYDALDTVQDGGGAQAAYLQAIAPETSGAERNVLRAQLLAYCKLDTLAMLRIWQTLLED